MNPIELSREAEPMEVLRELAERLEAAGGCMGVCDAALRYLKLRDGTRIACYVDGVRISGPALDAEVDK